MEKIYTSNTEYNKTKKRNSLIFSILLVVGMLGASSIFIINGQYEMLAFFGIFILLPIFLIPSIMKQYPTDGRAILTVTDKTVVTADGTFKFKDVLSFKVTIELPASRLDSENKSLIEKMKTIKPEDEYFGNLDLVVKDEKGKKKVVYTLIDHVIDATKTLLDKGVKHYEIDFSVKKLCCKNEYDLWGEMAREKEKNLSSTSKKERLKQLI